LRGTDDQLFLITGATGNTGATAVHLLLARGDHVRALVHREDARSAALAAAGAESCVDDLLDFPAVRAAMRGVTGASMDHSGIAAAVSHTLSIPVSYEPISVEEFAEGLERCGFPAHLVQHLGQVVVDYQHGIFAGTNSLIEVIGNCTPMTVEEYVESRKDAFLQSGPDTIVPKEA
jgi:NAD(P)-dependent dehydrogenase (short-subunit alcohol dehydrogenase family)